MWRGGGGGKCEGSVGLWWSRGTGVWGASTWGRHGCGGGGVGDVVGVGDAECGGSVGLEWSWRIGVWGASTCGRHGCGRGSVGDEGGGGVESVWRDEGVKEGCERGRGASRWGGRVWRGSRGVRMPARSSVSTCQSAPICQLVSEKRTSRTHAGKSVEHGSQDSSALKFLIPCFTLWLAYSVTAENTHFVPYDFSFGRCDHRWRPLFCIFVVCARLPPRSCRPPACRPPILIRPGYRASHSASGAAAPTARAGRRAPRRRRPQPIGLWDLERTSGTLFCKVARW